MNLSNLRKVLAFDAASCMLVFALCVSGGGLAAGITGLSPGLLAAGGWICLAAGLLFAVMAASRRPARPLLLLGIAGNVAWVTASVAIAAVYGLHMPLLGVGIVLAQAAAVAALTWIEIRGLGLTSSRAAAA